MISEGSVASGVRRIEELLVGKELRLAAANTFQLRKAASVMKTTPQEVLTRLDQVVREGKELRQQLDQMQSKLLASDAERFLYCSRKVEGLNVITTTLSSMSAGALVKIGDMLREKDESVVAVLPPFPTRRSPLTLSAVRRPWRPDSHRHCHHRRFRRRQARLRNGRRQGSPDAGQRPGSG